MKNDGEDRLDALLEELPREVSPERDLWAQIETGFRARGGSHASWRPAVWRLAAAAMLIVGSSLTTAWYLQRGMPTQVAAFPGDLDMVPASLTNDHGLGQKYRQARQLLLVDFDARFEQLPEESREAVIQNLQVIRTAYPGADETIDTWLSTTEFPDWMRVDGD